MVKPELKDVKPILHHSESEESNMDASDQDVPIMPKKYCDNEDGTVVVTFDEARARKGPRLCVFVGLFVFVLVVGFLAVYLIGRTHGKDRNHALSANMADDIARVPTLEPELANYTSKNWKEHSWETRDEMFQLSDTIGSNDIIGLRPIYRKDLPKDYIAYWEVKMNGKTGEKYLIISAAKETGDHRLAEEGTLPSPIDLMTRSARLHGHSCHKVFRLTPDGLMTCKDNTLRRTVAASRDIETNSEATQWRKLDKQVKKALTRFKKSWVELAKRVTKLPEWRRFKWLSMKSGQMPTKKSFNPDHDGRHDYDDDDEEYDYDIDEDDDDEVKAELGVKPGETLKVPLVGTSFQARIKFSGLGTRRYGRKRKTWTSRWQKRLCRVLDNACEGSDMTKVKWKYIRGKKMGDRYVELRIVSNSRYVRRQLQGQEIRFRVEVEMADGKTIVVNYGIMLKHNRKGRSIDGGRVNHFSIPHRKWFPDYKQHRHGQCMTGSGAVAWAMVFGYMDNLAHRVPQSGYPKNLLGLFPGSSPAPMTTTKHAHVAIENIFKLIASECISKSAAALTSPAKMKRIGKWLSRNKLQLIIENDSVKRRKATARAIKLLKERVPVIISMGRAGSAYQHYSVATRLRQRFYRYRDCSITCSPWRVVVENEAYVHLGVGKNRNRWENVDTHFMAAVLKQ